MTKLLICPGYVFGKNDGDKHFITAIQLLNLYKIERSKHEIKVCDFHQTFENRAKEICLCKEDGWILLHPLELGNYEEKILELGL